MNVETLLSEQIKGLKASIDLITDDAAMKDLCASFLADSLTALSAVRVAHPQAIEQINVVALNFANLATCLNAHNVYQIRALKKEKSNRTLLPNAMKEAARGAAQSFANSLWKADEARTIRIGQMAEMVWVKLIDMGYQSALPDKAESIVPWIRPIAEKEYKYAMKGGRPRKTP